MKNLNKEYVPNLSNNVYFDENSENFNALLRLYHTKKYWEQILQTSEYSQVLSWINAKLPLLNFEFFSIQTKVYWIFQGLTSFPCCSYCHHCMNDRNVTTISKGYPRYCSHSCAVNSPEIKQKTANTCLKRYGVTSPGQSSVVKEKSKNTCLRKYGTEYSIQSTNNKEKTKQTWLAKYGVEHAMKSPEIAAKCERTKQERYGNEQPWHSKDAYEKRQKTWNERYGVNHPMKLEQILKKAQNTILAKYGEKYVFGSPEFIYRTKKKIFERCILNSPYDEPLFTFDEFYNRLDVCQLLKFRCKKCGGVFESAHDDGHHSLCPKCYKPEYATSSEEKELATFISSYAQIETHNRTLISPKELDIVVKDRNLAFEFDGIYWHNDKLISDHNYHLKKTLACKEQGIQLIHVFENEWMLKQDIVKSRIRNLLGSYDETIFARKCVLKQVSQSECREFLLLNHLQGPTVAKVNLGLYFQDELVSLMTFGKSRFSKTYEWELVRFCNKLNCHIPGAAGKLLHRFEQEFKPTSLISYADQRWSAGKLYQALGFQQTHTSKPNYWYFHKNSFNLESRIKYQKHQLQTLLKTFNPQKTEYQNMSENGYFRIFDCGNLVYVKIYEQSSSQA